MYTLKQKFNEEDKNDNFRKELYFDRNIGKINTFTVKQKMRSYFGVPMIFSPLVVYIICTYIAVFIGGSDR